VIGEDRLLLAIDVSNTNTKLGLFREERLVASFRVSTERARTGDELGVLVSGLFAHAGIPADAVKAVIVASVVPPLRWALEEFVRRWFRLEALFVEPGIKTGMKVLFDNPGEVGADRIVNGVAAFALLGGPAVVVDLGTATTFDVVSAAGDYVGGVIAPGMLISAEALFNRAARLPLVALEKPARVIGRNTVACLQSGLFHGYVGLVEGILDRIQAELQAEPKVVATGGHAEILAAETRRIHRVESALTLEGLRILHERNR
jgi:type III pantothenate kinase